MNLLLADAASGLSTGQIALYPLAMGALGVPVKWWMSGTKSIAEDVRALTGGQSVQSREIAALQAHRQQHADEIK